MTSSPIIFDADTHYYEEKDCFSRYIEPKFREKAVQWKEVDGTDQLFVGDKPFRFLIKPDYETVVAPGRLAEMLRSGDYAALTGHGVSEFLEPTPDVFKSDRPGRMKLMDEHGVDASIILPTLGITVETYMDDDIEQTYANLRSFNTWQNETWGFNYQERLYAVPLMSLLDVDMAVEELERVLKLGARAVHLRPGPQGGRSPADPIFDPFWARLNEAKIPVAFHIAESGYSKFMAPFYGEDPFPRSHTQSAFQWTNMFGDRPMIDTISMLIYHNLFGRFPNINVMSIENGSLWAHYLIKLMDKMKGMARNGPWPGGYVKGRPSEVFKKHVFISPYHEEDVQGLADLIGPSQVIFGSDYPHMEGVEKPLDFKSKLTGMSKHDQDMIMGETTARIMGRVA